METSTRYESHRPMVKCSTCARDVDLVELADHVCSNDSMAMHSSFLDEPTQMMDNQSAYFPQRTASPFQRRPSPPRLESAMSIRSPRGLDPREAAHIAHDLGLPSPRSAGTGRKSPRPPPSRKGSSARLAAGPPSPDLPISQDCAFPRFPISKPKRSYTDRDTKPLPPRSASRANTLESTDSNSASSSQHSSSSSTLVKRRASGESSILRSRQGTINEIPSPPSTAPTSPRRSLEGTVVEAVKPLSKELALPPLETTVSSSSIGANSMESPATPVWPLPSHEASPPRSTEVAAFEPVVQDDRLSFEYDAPSEPQPSQDRNANQNVTFDRILQHQPPIPAIASSNQSDKEPLYKAKRPPPLAPPEPFVKEKRTAPVSIKSPTTGGLGRTLTNLFSRKRSQSVSSKKSAKLDMNSPRHQALAPDPPPVPYRGEGEFGAYAQQDSYFPPQQVSTSQRPPATSVSEVVSQQESPSATSEDSEKTKMIEQAPVNNAGFDFKFDSTAAVESSEKRVSQVMESDFENALARVSPTAPVAQSSDLRRLSTDSASSYGSIRYSAQTISSQSSPPPSEEVGSLASAAPDSTDTLSMFQELSQPPQPVAAEPLPESPTDPYYQEGYFSPITEPQVAEPTPSIKPRTSLAEVLPIPPEPVTVPYTPQVPLARPSTPAGTKGICRGCSSPILAGQKSVSSKDGRLTGRYHKECFTCNTCREPFSTADFYVYEDHPYCSYHYHVKNNTLCAACGSGIEGQYLETFAGSADSKKYHSLCLTCTTCRIQLKDDYFELQGRVYCERDAFRAANGPVKSPYDNAPSRPSPLVREYISSDAPGLKGRFPERRTTRLMMT